MDQRKLSPLKLNTSLYAQKDVSHKLIKERKRRRAPGEVPYPAEYTNEAVNYCNWFAIGSITIVKGLTLSKLETVPAKVLDLGCGGGFWVITAAKLWTTTEFVGFDIKDMQPDLKRLSEFDLARRIQWIHGNFLETLPFPTDHFDFVRVSHLGLCVPEDEWQYVLEEIVRVMKPGGLVEILEEDLVFPCSQLQSSSKPPSIATVSSSPPSSTSSKPSSTIPAFFAKAIPATISSSRRSEPGTPSVHFDIPSNPVSRWPSSESEEILPPYTLHSAAPTKSVVPTNVENADTFDVRDHSKLKEAWDEMLHHRFFAPKLLSVLPFYLCSMLDDVKTHSPVQVPLPPSSRDLSRVRHVPPPEETAVERAVELESMFDELTENAKPPTSRESVEKGKKKDPDPLNLPGTHLSSTNLSIITNPWQKEMHLGHTVNTVITCKEAIWTAYEKLHRHDPLPKTLPPRRSNKTTMREDFETYWHNWRCDMEDRMGMRTNLKVSLGWVDPIPSTERPDWKVWSDRLQGDPTPRYDHSDENPRDICRVIQGFVGWKPVTTPAS